MNELDDDIYCFSDVDQHVVGGPRMELLYRRGSALVKQRRKKQHCYESDVGNLGSQPGHLGRRRLWMWPLVMLPSLASNMYNVNLVSLGCQPLKFVFLEIIDTTKILP